MEKILRQNILRVSILSFIISLRIVSFSQDFLGLSLHSEVDHVQPMTGIVFWSANNGDLNTLGDKVQLEFSYLIYSDVIQNEGSYDWSVVDNLLQKASNRGRQVVLRFRYTYPGQTKVSVPSYITSRSDYTIHYQNVEGSNTFIPDWTNETLEDFTLEFYTKFAERYDDDPRLVVAQVGFGSYAEYHLWSGPSNPVGTYFPSKDFQATFLTHLNSVFINTQWGISIDAASSSYTPLSSNASLRGLNFGLFDDSFLHSSHSTSDNEYNRSNWLTFGTDRANDHMAGGELNYYSQWDQEHVLDVAGPYGFTYEEMADMYDISYMLGNDQLNYQSAARIEAAAMSSGYHYEVTEFSSDGNSTKVIIKNTGIAPIYYDAYPTVNGVRATESLKGVIAGQSKTFIIASVASGEDLSIECDRLVSGQEIQYDADLEEVISAISDDREDSGYTIYPNPTEDFVYLPKAGQWRLRSAHGEVLRRGKSKRINMSKFPNGVYFIKFRGKTERIIKN